MESLGLRLHKLRRRKGKIYTQRKVASDLSKLLGKPISHSSYSNWENGVYHPDIRSLKALASYFNVSTDYLLNGNDKVGGGSVFPEMEILQEIFTTGNFQERAIVARVVKSVFEALKIRNGKSYKKVFRDPLEAYDAMLDISFRTERDSRDLQEVQVGLLIEKAKICEKRGHYKLALTSLENALDLAKNIGANRDQIEFLYRKQATIRTRMGYYSYALSLFREAYRHSYNTTKKAKNLNNMGIICDLLGEYDKAIECYRSAIDIYTEDGSSEYLPGSLHNVGITYLKTGRYQEALDNFLSALTLSKETGNRREEALNLNSIGLIYEILGLYSKSIKYFTEALEIFKEIKNVHETTRTLMNIGVYYRHVGNPKKSLETLHESYQQWFEMEDQDGIGECLNEMGMTYLALKDLVRSEECLLEAKDISLRIRNKGFEVSTLKNLAILKLEQDRLEEAMDYINDAIELGELIKEPTWEFHYIKGKIFKVIGKEEDYIKEMSISRTQLEELINGLNDGINKRSFVQRIDISEIIKSTERIKSYEKT